MKRKLKLLSLLLIMVLMGSCSKDSTDENPEQNNMDPTGDPITGEFTFTFNINSEIINAPIRMLISNAEGTILGEETVSGNIEQIQITVNAPEDTVFDLTSVAQNIDQNGNANPSILINQDIAPGTYNFNSAQGFNPPFGESIKLNITNLGPRPIKRPSHGQLIFSHWSPADGGTVDFQSIASYAEEYGGYYMSLIRDNETEERYYWSENPPITDTQVINFEELPVQTNFITMSTPPDFTQSTTLLIQGFHPNNDSSIWGSPLAYRDGASGFPPLTYGLPAGIFNRFRISTLHLRGNKGYWLVRTSSEPFTVLPTSNISMNVFNPALSSFSAEIEGNGDIYQMLYLYTDPQEGKEYELRIVGDPKPSVAYSKNVLLNNILDGEVSPSNFQLVNVVIYDYEDLDSYEQYLANLFDGSLNTNPDWSEYFTRYLESF